MPYFSIACHPVDLTKKNCAFDTQNSAARVYRRLCGSEAMVPTTSDCEDHSPSGYCVDREAAPSLQVICGVGSDPIVHHPGLAPLGPHRTPLPLLCDLLVCCLRCVLCLCVCCLSLEAALVDYYSQYVIFQLPQQEEGGRICCGRGERSRGRRITGRAD